MDGVQEGSQSRTGDIVGTDNPLDIGDGYPTSDPLYDFKGNIDDLPHIQPSLNCC